MLFQKVQQIFTHQINNDFFLVCLLLTNHVTLKNLNIVLSFHQPFEPIAAPFTITGLLPIHN